MRRKLIVVSAGIFIVAALAAWFAYPPLRERRLIAKLALGDDAAVASLQRSLEQCPVGEARRERLIERIAEAFPSFPLDGQLAALRLCESKDTQRILSAGLVSPEPSVRARAASLAPTEMMADLVPLLRDPAPDVRRVVLKIAAPQRQAIPDDALLPLLHDADADLRHRAEAALRARGLRDKEIHIGKMVSDPSPLKRLEVISQLPSDADLDPEVWLKKLCDDPSPAVRANAACAAMDPTSTLGVDLRDRVRHMAQRDPDGTVRQIADYLIRTQAK